MTFLSALPTLLKIASNPRKYAPMLGCHGQERLHSVPATSRESAILDWSACPLDLIDSPFFHHVLAIDRLAKVSPVANWPDRFAPWLVGGLLSLREHRGN